MLTNLQIDVTQDRQPINEELISRYHLQKRDIVYLKDNKARTNFVGVVQNGPYILLSIPKHFKNINEFKSYDNNKKSRYIKLIMDSIVQSTKGYRNTNYDSNIEIASNIAINAYFNVYQYFVNYGMYHEENSEIKPNHGNKISWKDTFRKANKYITKQGIIYSPLFYKKKKDNETIVTESMIFVINYTYQLLGDYMNLSRNTNIARRGVNKSILGNSAVIHKLQTILSMTFKDIDRNLIRNIIIFLKKANSSKKMILEYKCYDYENVWEKAVHKYLNTCFDKVDEKGNLLFTSSHHLNSKFKKDPFHYNEVEKNNKWNIEPDHYYLDTKNKIIYLLDSKYYTKIDELNHKQFVYHILLSNLLNNLLSNKYLDSKEYSNFKKFDSLISNEHSDFKIFDSLIMPTEGNTRTEDYVNIKKEYLFNSNKPIIIHLTHINMIDVLTNYLS